MNIEQIIKKIYEYNPKEANPTLKRISFLMDYFDNIQEKIKCIHVAGTNGKGSTCAMLSNILKEAGYKTGLYTSPHLIKINERYKINGVDISDEDFIFYATKVLEATEKIEKEKLFDDHINTFEILTAIAFLYFYDKKVDILILEVGLGGQMDATNIIKKPLVSIIVNIGYDHTKILGTSIIQIAKSKMGIIKKECPIVLYDYDDKNITKVFVEKAKKENATIFITNRNNKFNYELSLLGNHQKMNALCVKESISILQNLGYNIKEEDIINGFKTTPWNARLQLLEKGDVEVYLDGAHNVQCIQSLANFFNNKKLVCITAILDDKDIENMALEISKITKDIILTNVHTNRKTNTQKLLQTFSKYSNKVKYIEDLQEAINEAKKILNNKGIILITGSLYLCGEALSLYEKNKQ
ncbi:MAG: folylpolyglutamate synthase/dihydrofolate synthase family protein [Eubacteriales bacterium]|nr:folylpolyglutamate synthase/dihydrofolate synthase family protein [Eubacteriales bacterium]